LDTVKKKVSQNAITCFAAPIVNGLEGVGYHITAARTGLQFLSMEGGAPITIYGANMADDIANDHVLFLPNWLQNVQLFGPVLTGKYTDT
jgi:hypothetical protein